MPVIYVSCHHSVYETDISTKRQTNVYQKSLKIFSIQKKSSLALDTFFSKRRTFTFPDAHGSLNPAPLASSGYSLIDHSYSPNTHNFTNLKFPPHSMSKILVVHLLNPRKMKISEQVTAEVLSSWIWLQIPATCGGNFDRTD